MKKQIAAVLFLSAASALADPCPQAVGKIAIRLFPGDALAGHADLPLKQGGTPLPLPARPSNDPDLKDFWIFNSTALLTLPGIKDLEPSVACMSFTQRTNPMIDRLADGKCYALFELNAKPTCWSLRVVSKPIGYPFQVRLGSKSYPLRLESGSDTDWNLEKGLPLGPSATVEIFDRHQKKKRLLAIGDITYVRLISDPTEWELDKSKLDGYSSALDNQVEVRDEAERLVRKLLIQKLEYIHLQLDKGQSR